MNRLLLTAAAIVSMGVSSHAMAATYTIDGFSGSPSALTAQTLSALNSSTTNGTIASYSSDGMTFGRSILFQKTAGPANRTSKLIISNGELKLMNAQQAASKLTLTYDIGALNAVVGTGNASFNLGIKFTDAAGSQPLTVAAFFNGASTAFDTWTVTAPVDSAVNPILTHDFNLTGAQLDGTDALTFVVTGSNAYNATFAPFQVSVSPVPELGLLPMFGTGLLAVGFAARRKRAASN